MYYSTGELAKAFGLTNEGVRHLEKQGVIGSERFENGYRRFNYDQYTRLRRYKMLQMAGFDVHESLRMINSDYSLTECEESFENNLAKIREKKRLLDEAEKDLLEKINSIHSIKEGESAWRIIEIEPFAFWLRKKNGVGIKNNYSGYRFERNGEMKMMAFYNVKGDELKGTMLPRKALADDEICNLPNITICYPGKCLTGTIAAKKFERPDLEQIFSWMNNNSITPAGDVYCIMNLTYHNDKKEDYVIHEFWAPIENG